MVFTECTVPFLVLAGVNGVFGVRGVLHPLLACGVGAEASRCHLLVFGKQGLFFLVKETVLEISLSCLVNMVS